jgi:hypothetical protein
MLFVRKESLRLLRQPEDNVQVRSSQCAHLVVEQLLRLGKNRLKYSS